MRLISTLALLLMSIVILAQGQKDYPIQAVPFTQVTLNDQFWSPRLEVNRTITIPASFEQCKTTGRIRNFEMAAARQGKHCTVYPFDDTDLYKIIEGASYSLKIHPDPKLELYIDTLITLFGKAQESDGYLFTPRTIDPLHTSKTIGNERWVNERQHSHELYNAGHLFEAAYAHYLATGKRSLLDIALKNADLIEATFGPDKRHVAPGHQVIEMGLVKLYRATGKEKYLKLAKYFLDERGQIKYDSTSRDVFKNGMYWQDHKPVVKQTEAVGHAVRAVYMYSGMADVAALTGDKEYINAIGKIWENAVGRKLYVTGGIGAAGEGERFGNDYELPNATAYCETCASIGNVYWNHRMFMLLGDARYIDVLERSLYNSLLSGVGIDGKTFFYTNTLQIKDHFRHPDIELKRSTWFPCSCCPTNVTRVMPSIPGYVYGQRDQDIYVNLFIAGTASLKLTNGSAVTIRQEGNYPWDGNIKLLIEPAKKSTFTVRVRIPGWATDAPVQSDLYTFADKTSDAVELSLNGAPLQIKNEKGYAVIHREWKKGDRLELKLPMPVRRILAHKEIADDVGKISLQRGPLMYCAEAIDNFGKTGNLIIPQDINFTTQFNKDLLKGVVIITGDVPSIKISGDGKNVTTEKIRFTAIPYYAWAHRGEGEMSVWFPQQVKAVELITK